MIKVTFILAKDRGTGGGVVKVDDVGVFHVDLLACASNGWRAQTLASKVLFAASPMLLELGTDTTTSLHTVGGVSMRSMSIAALCSSAHAAVAVAYRGCVATRCCHLFGARIFRPRRCECFADSANARETRSGRGGGNQLPTRCRVLNITLSGICDSTDVFERGCTSQMFYIHGSSEGCTSLLHSIYIYIYWR
jgi:hypothetical protein